MPHRVRAPEKLGLFALVLGALALRVGWVGVNLFDFDQAQVSWLALRLVRGGEFNGLGMPSSAVLPNFPASVWAFALPFAVAPDPLLATLMMGLVGTGTVVGGWWLARQVGGPWAGLCAALLLASSPYAVLYSRDIWSQDWLIPLALAWAVTAARGLARQDGRWLAAHYFVAGVAFQIHYAGLALLLASGWLFIYYRLWRHWRAVLLGGVGAAVCAAPAVYTLGCCRPEVRAGLRALADQPALIDGQALTHWATLLSGRQWEALFLRADWVWSQWLTLGLNGAVGWASLLFGLGCVAAVRQAFGAQRSTRAHIVLTLLPLWLLLPPLLFTRHSVQPQLHYQLPALPAGLLLMSAAAGLSQRRGWGALIFSLTLMLALPRGVALAQHFEVIRATPTGGGMGTPLLYPRAAARYLQTPAPVVVLAPGDDPAFVGDVVAFEVLLWGVPHQVVDGRSTLLLPSAPDAQLFATDPALPGWNEAVDNQLVDIPHNFPRRAGDPPYVAATLLPDPALDWQPAPADTLANGAQLLGWRVRLVNGQWRVLTRWRLTRAFDGQIYHQFHHLYAADQLLAIQDVPTSSRAWQAQDTLWVWTDFDPPPTPGPFWVDVGMYALPDGQRSPVIDPPRADPLAPIRLGPFEGPVP